MEVTYFTNLILSDFSFQVLSPVTERSFLFWGCIFILGRRWSVADSVATLNAGGKAQYFSLKCYQLNQQ